MHVHTSSCEVPVILAVYKRKLNLLDRFSKHTQTKFHENSSSESRVFPCGQTDGQTDITKLIVTFRNFVNAPKTVIFNFINNYLNVN